MKARILATALSFTALISATPSTVFAQDALLVAPTATDFVRTRAESILATINLAAADPTTLEAQRASLRGAVAELLSFELLSQRTLGDHWTTLDATQQAEFVALLRQLIETSYSRQLGKHSVEANQYQVTFTDERTRNDRVTVEASLAVRGDAHVIELKLMNTGAGYIAYDIVTDDVSLEESYAESFENIITEHGFSGLLQRMRDRLAEMTN